MGKFKRVYRVRGTEIAPDYTMRRNFAACYFQEAFAELCASKKLAAYDLQRNGRTWLIMDINIEFLSPEMPFWRDEVAVEAWAYKTTPLYLIMNFQMSSNGRPVAKASYASIVVDEATRKPQRISELAGSFDLIDEPVFDVEDFGKIQPFGDPVGRCFKEVSSAEVDFNNHLTNMQYPPSAFEAIPLDYRMGRNLRAYRVKFIKEALLGDIIFA